MVHLNNATLQSVLVEDWKLALLDENRHAHPADEIISLVTT